MIAVVDADVLVYQLSFAHQECIKWHRDLWSYYAYEERATAAADAFLEQLEHATGADEIAVVLSDADSEANYRRDCYPTYKSQRGSNARPMLYTVLRDHFIEQHQATWEPRLEGDDLLGLAADQAAILCTIDKDLRTVPGLHYNWDRPDEGVVEVTPEEADRYFHLQTLTGDSTDGYKGCPGVGPVKAGRLLEAVEEDPWTEAVVPAFVKAGLSEEVALANARCARILRPGEYNFETQEVMLWQP